MSILIRGMEMPKNCRTCPMLFDGHSYRWCNITGESLGIEETDNGRDEYCPLIELPPHGRLIDVDDFMRHLIINTADLRTLSTGTVGKALHDTPTIIEAEGETE